MFCHNLPAPFLNQIVERNIYSCSRENSSLEHLITEPTSKLAIEPLPITVVQSSSSSSKYIFGSEFSYGIVDAASPMKEDEATDGCRPRDEDGSGARGTDGGGAGVTEGSEAGDVDGGEAGATKGGGGDADGSGAGVTEGSEAGVTGGSEAGDVDGSREGDADGSGAGATDGGGAGAKEDDRA